MRPSRLWISHGLLSRKNLVDEPWIIDRQEVKLDTKISDTSVVIKSFKYLSAMRYELEMLHGFLPPFFVLLCSNSGCCGSSIFSYHNDKLAGISHIFLMQTESTIFPKNASEKHCFHFSHLNQHLTVNFQVHVLKIYSRWVTIFFNDFCVSNWYENVSVSANEKSSVSIKLRYTTKILEVITPSSFLFS